MKKKLVQLPNDAIRMEFCQKMCQTLSNILSITCQPFEISKATGWFSSFHLQLWIIWHKRRKTQWSLIDMPYLVISVPPMPDRMWACRRWSYSLWNKLKKNTRIDKIFSFYEFIFVSKTLNLMPGGILFRFKILALPPSLFDLDS